MDDDLATGNGSSSTTDADAAPAAIGAAATTTGVSRADAGDTPTDSGDGSEEAAPKRKRGRPKGSTARTTRVVTMTLTVSGSADGEWQAELKQGSSWVARGLPVPAAAVSAAAAALHADIAKPVDELIESAKAVKAARVAELEAELEQAKKALAELEQ